MPVLVGGEYGCGPEGACQLLHEQAQDCLSRLRVLPGDTDGLPGVVVHELGAEQGLADRAQCLRLRFEHRLDGCDHVGPGGGSRPAGPGHEQDVRALRARVGVRAQPGQGEKELAAHPGAPEEAEGARAPSVPTVALVEQKLEAEHIAHGRLGQQGCVVQGRAPGQLVFSGVEPQGCLDLGPKKGHPVEPLVQGREYQSELQSLRLKFEPLLCELGFVLCYLAGKRRSLEGPGRTVEQGVEQGSHAPARPLLLKRVQDVVGQPRQIVGEGAVRPTITEGVITEDIEDLGEPVPTGGPGGVLHNGCRLGRTMQGLLVVVECGLVHRVVVLDGPLGRRIPGVE